MKPAASRLQALVVAALIGGLIAAPLHAEFESEELGDDVYYVAFERSGFMAGGMFDTDKVARKKLASHTGKLCREEGYAFVKWVTVREMRDDDDLRAAWREATGEEPNARTSLSDWSRLGGRTVHHGRRSLVVLSKSKKNGFERCR